MVDVSFPFRSKFQFRDQKGNLVTLDSPELHRFLLTLYKRTGGTDDTIQSNTNAIGDIETDNLSLTERVELLEDDVDTLGDRSDALEYKVAVLELQQALGND